MVSDTLTVPAVAGFIAKVTMIVLPAATPPAGTVTTRVVPDVVPFICPTLVGVPMAANAALGSTSVTRSVKIVRVSFVFMPKSGVCGCS